MALITFKGGNFILNQLKARKTELELKIQEIQDILPTLPEGNFFLTNSNNQFKWYTGQSPSYQYIPKKNRKLAEQLAYRKFLTLKLQESKDELTSLTNYLTTLSKLKKADNLIIQSPEYQTLIAHFYAPISEDYSSWQNKPYDQNNLYPESLIHKSISGNTLRSKSEAIIDSLLFQNKIPFRYECQLILGEHILYPDFTIKHPITGKLYYWEHFGLMDNHDYAKKTAEKLHTYISYGIIPSITLLTTYETKSTPLTTEKVSHIIKQYFLN